LERKIEHSIEYANADNEVYFAFLKIPYIIRLTLLEMSGILAYQPAKANMPI
jgi:hypothetical protein